MRPFKLMTSLYAHTGDVKGLSGIREPDGFVSVSRDLSAKLWHASSDGKNFTKAQEISVHKKFVNSVVVVYTVEDYPNGLIITGSNDQTIAIHDIESNKTIAQLKEHQGAVCTIYYDNNSKSNYLYTGSFDCTAKVWNLNDLVKSDFNLSSSVTAKGHDHTVWGILGLEKHNSFLTASADKSIKHWRLNDSRTNAENVCKYVGHTDCVRALAQSRLNPENFLSCSNDGTVIQWKLLQSTPLRTIRVTDSFLYSINVLYNTENDGSEYFATSGEDRTLRIHSLNNNVEQSIALPSQSLWYTLGLVNGNVAVACSDGSIRLFTQNEKLFASKTEQDEYERELGQFAIPVKSNQEIAQLDRSKLPGIEALSIPGKKDAQTLMINNENEIEVYQWDMAESRWVKIGVAVGSSDGAGTGSKITYLGKEYDYVFDIELDDVGTKLKLPYNLSEDPYFAAQKFIHEHELSQTFLDQIAHFIINNTQGQTIGNSNSGSTYYDPFTGEGRYVPQGPTNTNSSSASSYVDPFTGSGAYHTSSATQAPKKAPIETTNDYYPLNEYILFDQKNFEPILKKLRELQQKLAETKQSSNELITDKSNLELIENLMVNFDESKSIDSISDQIDFLFQVLDAWPIESVFPLIDLVRILSLNKHVANYITREQNLNHITTKTFQNNEGSNCYLDILFDLISEKNVINSMLVLKIITNLFKSLDEASQSNSLTNFILKKRAFILDQVKNLQNTQNKSFEIALSTLLLNYSVLFRKMININSSNNLAIDLLIELVGYLNEPSFCECALKWDTEALFRIEVCVGTLLFNSKSLKHDYLDSVTKSLDTLKTMCVYVNSDSQRYPEKLQKCNNHLTKLLN